MVNYSKSVIYKIIHFENSELCYIGSTCNFKNRKCQHKNYCYNVNRKAYNFKLYQMIRDHGGWSAFKMVAIEEFPCDSKTQLCIREEEVRVEYKANMNMVKAHITADELNEYHKQYRINHREELNEKKKEKVTCECGCVVSKRNLSQHKTSKKHLNSRDETPT